MSLGRRTASLVALGGLAVSGTAGCDSLTFAGQDPSWQEPSSYTYTLRSSEGKRVLMGTFRITVEDRKVAMAEGLNGPAKQAVKQYPHLVPTIGGLLREVEQAREANAYTADVESAPDGRPTRIVLDWDDHTIDDEATYVITAYEETDR